MPNTHDRTSSSFGPELVGLLVISVWGSTFTLTKSLFEEMHPLAFGFVRFLAIVAIAWTVLLIEAKRANRPDWLRIRRTDIPMFVLTGICGYTVYQLGFILGLEHTSPFSGSLMISLQPLVTLGIVSLLGERQPRTVWIGALVALVGVTIFLFTRDGESRLLGNMISFGGGVGFALYQVFNRRLLREYHHATYSAWSTTLGCIPLWLISARGAASQDWSAISTASWATFAYMCVFPVYLAYILWGWAIKQRGVALAGLTLLVPVVAGVMSWLFRGERFDAQKLIGGAIAMIGLVVMQLANRRRPSTPHEMTSSSHYVNERRVR